MYIAGCVRSADRVSRHWYLGTPGKEVEEAVDHVAVPPGDGAADAAEDDAVGDELVNFIQVEAVVSCCP